MMGMYDTDDFAGDVLEQSYRIPVLVDFWAEWCGPCKMLGPILERLAGQSDSRWTLRKVDTDKHQDIAVRYGIRSIPNVKLFVKGEVANEFTGALPERAVVQWLEKALPGKFEKEIAEAQRMIDEGKTPEARRLLEGIVKEDAGNEEAKTELARTYLFDETERAVDLVRTIEPHSKFFPMAEMIRTVGDLLNKARHPEALAEDPVKGLYLDGIRALGRRDYAGALGIFIEVIRTNRYYDDDGSRKACIALFRLVGDDSELARRYRRDFGSALNR
jgi:putative thioredoxin